MCSHLQWALRQWYQLAEGWCPMTWKITILAIRFPTICGSERDNPPHHGAPLILYAVTTLKIIYYIVAKDLATCPIAAARRASTKYIIRTVAYHTWISAILSAALCPLPVTLSQLLFIVSSPGWSRRWYSRWRPMTAVAAAWFSWYSRSAALAVVDSCTSRSRLASCSLFGRRPSLEAAKTHKRLNDWRRYNQVCR